HRAGLACNAGDRIDLSASLNARKFAGLSRCVALVSAGIRNRKSATRRDWTAAYLKAGRNAQFDACDGACVCSRTGGDAIQLVLESSRESQLYGVQNGLVAVRMTSRWIRRNSSPLRSGQDQIGAALDHVVHVEGIARYPIRVVDGSEHDTAADHIRPGVVVIVVRLLHEELAGQATAHIGVDRLRRAERGLGIRRSRFRVVLEAF